MRKLNYDLLPQNSRVAMRKYIENGVLPQGNLFGLLCGKVIQVKDDEPINNLLTLRSYLSFLNDQAPFICWGSDIKVQTWSVVGGMYGLETKHIRRLQRSIIKAITTKDERHTSGQLVTGSKSE